MWGLGLLVCPDGPEALLRAQGMHCGQLLQHVLAQSSQCQAIFLSVARKQLKSKTSYA